MTIAELIEKLQTYPQDSLVTTAEFNQIEERYDWVAARTVVWDAEDAAVCIW